MQRIGVFVCHCGSNIAATVDVKKVVEMALMEPGVVHAEDYQYMCSEAGQAKIAAAIKEKKLTGIVVCSCSPPNGNKKKLAALHNEGPITLTPLGACCNSI